jgi:predicted sulfurtransferase
MITSVTSCFVSTHVIRVPYSSQELDIETAAGTKCVDCGTDATTQWFDCKEESGNKMCRPCSNKNRLDVTAVAGTTCVKCGTDTTSDWINCKETPRTKICRACHSKNARNKKAAMAKEK